MDKEQFDQSSCNCHVNPPCNKCMVKCPECSDYFGEEGATKCESCGVEL